LEKFRAQAVRFGIDEEEYLNSLKKIPVVSEDELLHITGFLGRMATLLSELGYAKIVIKEESELLKREIETRERIEKERKKLEVQLQHSQRMESIGRLAGGIAHDFNNMLSVIRGFSDLSLRQIDESHPLYKNIKEISKAAESSSNIIRQLLIFSGQQNVKSENLELNASVKKLLPMLQMLVGKNIELKLHLSDEKLNIKIAPGQLEQILLNLCSNSKKAIKNHGAVKISTRRIDSHDAGELFPLPADGRKNREYYALISVEDNGCGMNQDIIDNVFEPFFTTGDDTSSSGLGMSTVYGIVKQNGGSIRISSRENRGTTVDILFPLI
jgi:signal transduction histidine kinase